MKQDIESTKLAFTTPNDEFTYPGVIYVEHANGNIAPVIVVNEKGNYTEYFWDLETNHENDRHNLINSALKLAPHSQSSAKVFVINNASLADIERVLGQALDNKKPEQV